MYATVLVTGGAGYIGAHVVVALARAGYAPLILDNFANSSKAVLPRLTRLVGADVPLIVADVRDRAALSRTFAEHRIEAVVHCAGLKAVADGEAQPLAYYDNNVAGSIALSLAMHDAGVRTLVFSSSASVYRQPERHPGLATLNLGLGHGASVLEVIAAFERACGKPLRRRIAPRRPGDVAIYYADPARANAMLRWRARRDLDAICVDAWRWRVAAR